MSTLGSGGAGSSTNQGFPSTTRNAITTNFTSLVDFGTGAEQTPFLPETLDKQVKRFGNRSISGLLTKMAAEYALQSDKIQWTEQNRLHIKATGITRASATVKVFDFQDGQGFREGQTVILVQTNGANAGVEHKGLISDVTGNAVTVESYAATVGTNQGFLNLGTADITAIVYGSEFAKGTTGMEGSLDVTYVNRSNEPIIMKDKYSVTGSDVAQIGWIEVQDVNGDGGHGFLWYLQSEMDQRARFMDYVETAMVEAVPAATGTTATESQAAKVTGITGSRGLFYELEQYGSTFTGGFDDTSASDGIDDFDTILKQLDTQGNIEENMLYLNRNQTLKIDNILGNQSQFGGGTGSGGGPSWGSFANSKSMALSLGFDGWRRGSYDFYKTDWKYLNDSQARRDFGTSGAAGQSNIQGIMVPGGSSSVYDEMLSSTIKRPMLHVRYRAAQGENRKMKNWVTGSVGGVYTSDADRMDVHYLSERCLVVQAANNFAIFKRA